MTVPVAPSVLGLPVDCMTPGAYAAWICDTAVRWRSAPPTASAARQVVTLNPEMVMAAQRDPALRKAIHQAALVVPDGIGIVWAARVLGFPLLGRVAGVDMLDAVASLAVARSLRLFLLGAAPGVAQEAARRLVQRHACLPAVATASWPARWRWALAARWTSSPGGWRAPRAGCAVSGSNGPTGSCGNQGAGGACWLCHASPWPCCAKGRVLAESDAALIESCAKRGIVRYCLQASGLISCWKVIRLASRPHAK